MDKKKEKLFLHFLHMEKLERGKMLMEFLVKERNNIITPEEKYQMK